MKKQQEEAMKKQQEAFFAILQKSLPEESLDAKKREYSDMLVNTYLTGEVKDDDEFLDYLKELVEPEKPRQQLLEAIRGMKAKQEVQQEKPAEKEKAPEKEKEKEAEKPREPREPREWKGKGKREEGIFERLQDGEEGKTGSKRVKKDREAKEGDEKGEGLKQRLESTGKKKCRFFPFCRNPDACEYFHPTEKCSYFPNCRYADDCLYLHEGCKFKGECTKANCPYAHPFRRRSNPLEELLKTVMHTSNPIFKHKGPKQPRDKAPAPQ